MSLTAIILAGGKGTRLEPWRAPKCLLPICGVPIIHRITEHLRPFVARRIICVGYRAEDVRRSFVPCGENVEFSDAGEDATMIERVLHARQEHHLENEHLLVCYGDGLADVDIPELMKAHVRSKSFMTITSHVERLPFGVLDGGRIVDGKEVDVNIGFAIAEPQAWKYASSCPGLSDFFNKMHWCVDGQNSTSVYEHMGRHSTINNPSDIAKAEELWK